MAHSAPRFGTPKTPQHLEHEFDDSPSETMPRPNNTARPYKQCLIGAVIAIVLILWMQSSKSSPKQTDRIPFTHDPVEE